MDVSPFPHHGPLRPDQVRGRDDLISTLEHKIAHRKVTALLGPRRFGKTSVLRRVAADLEAASTSVLWIDLFEVTSLVDVALRLDAALDANRSRVGRTARSIAASIEVSIGGAKLAFARRDRPDPIATVHVLLDLIVSAALESSTTIILDEFSGIARVDGAAGLFRTKLQHHFTEIGLVFAGSAPSTMRTMFSTGEQPFYGQADLVTIDALSASAVHDLVTEGFEATGRDPGALPGRVYDLGGGHPRRTMQLADQAWELAEPAEPYTEALWVATVAAVEAATADAHEAVFAGLGESEKKVVRILASGGALHGRAGELLGLSSSSASHAVETLTDKGHITGGRLVDPLFANWARRRLPV